MLLSELIRIFFIIFFAFGSVTTIFIVVQLINHYRLPGSKKSSVMIRFSAVTFIWATVSLVFLLLLVLSSIGDRVGQEPEIKHFTDAAGHTVLFIIWLLTDGALIYWTSRPPKMDKIKSLNIQSI